jgi:hypothetical protein
LSTFIDIGKGKVDAGCPRKIITLSKKFLMAYTSFIHSSMALHPFVGPLLLQFRNPFYTDGRTPWTSDRAVARPLPTHRTTQTQNKRKHPYFEWVPNP